MRYIVNAHNVVTGHTDRRSIHTKAAAVFEAERLFNRGEYLWVDVVAEDKRGRITYPHHVERQPTEAERAAICARYGRQAV